jgi:hypothetical protein
MGLNPRSQWFVVMARILGLLAVLALAVPAAEARFKMKWKRTPTSSSIPSASKSSTPSAKLDASNEHTTARTARGFSTSLVSGQCQDRGLFRRTWDWLFGRKHEPAPAPQAPSPPGSQAVAAAPPSRPEGCGAGRSRPAGSRPGLFWSPANGSGTGEGEPMEDGPGRE